MFLVFFLLKNIINLYISQGSLTFTFCLLTRISLLFPPTLSLLRQAHTPGLTFSGRDVVGAILADNLALKLTLPQTRRRLRQAGIGVAGGVKGRYPFR